MTKKKECASNILKQRQCRTRHPKEHVQMELSAKDRRFEVARKEMEKGTSSRSFGRALSTIFQEFRVYMKSMSRFSKKDREKRGRESET